MKCPRCKAEVEPGDIFCGECGCPLQDLGQPQDAGPVKKKKGSIVPVILLAVLIIAVAAGFAGWFLYNYLEDRRGQETADRIREEISGEEEDSKEDGQDQTGTDDGETTGSTDRSQSSPQDPADGTGVSQDYIFPDSAFRYLTDADVVGMSIQEINYGKNEIYARHGRKFKSQELTDYFSSKSWYQGLYEPDDFDANYTYLLNEYEKRNAEFLNEKEHQLDSQGYITDAD